MINSLHIKGQMIHVGYLRFYRNKRISDCRISGNKVQMKSEFLSVEEGISWDFGNHTFLLLTSKCGSGDED